MLPTLLQPALKTLCFSLPLRMSFWVEFVGTSKTKQKNPKRTPPMKKKAAAGVL